MLNQRENKMVENKKEYEKQIRKGLNQTAKCES